MFPIQVAPLITMTLRSRIPQMKEVVKMIRNHFDGILNHWDLHLINSKLALDDTIKSED
ncbi:MAG: transposase [Clostridiales Family XIII bacterium]|nr:transposase [Clostridiales Family XIII bacterium]